MRKRGIITRETACIIEAKCLYPKKTEGTHKWCDGCRVHRRHTKSGKQLNYNCMGV